MQEIIDVPSNAGVHAVALASSGVKSIIRYYNHQNSNRLPTKCLSRAELDALHAAGLSVAVVFEQRGGAGGIIADFSTATGNRDAGRALALAAQMGQPQGSGIYFAVDDDFIERAHLDRIIDYFAAVRHTVNGRYRIGVYGSGLVARTLTRANLVELIWLSGSLGWSGTRAEFAAGRWTLFQKDLSKTSPLGFGYDGNIFNPASSDFGQFRAHVAEAVHAEVPQVSETFEQKNVYEVTARSGLKLRSGPSEDFGSLHTVPLGTHVDVHGQSGPWMKVDLDGDGAIDGFMHGDYLRAVSGGLPVNLPHPRRPIDVAWAELAIGVHEVTGSQHNPRIVMYHATTTGGSAPDETAWCSSFVNYCAEQAGHRGTDSKWARSWHDSRWGQDVTGHPQEGDIVVFSRRSPTEDGGHVAFYLREEGDWIWCLGGNQGDSVSKQKYPRDGNAYGYHYRLLSIRRG